MEEAVTPQAVQAVVRSSSTHHRDLRLDFWRGLCIVDMVLVHLVNQGLHAGTVTSLIIADYTRFAAGGFVFLSGLCVGVIHLRRASDPQRRWGVYTGMLRRAGFILLVHYLATLTALLLCPLKGDRLDLAETFIDTLLLREGYDLLPFYVCMIAICPLLLELLRRGHWWIIAGASAAAFALGCSNPWVIGFPLQHDFFPLLWQLIFVAGLLGGWQLAWYDKLDRRHKRLGLAICSLAMLILTMASRMEAGGAVLPLHLTFAKVPLSLGEVMRYVSIILTILLSTDLIWNWIADTRLSKFISRLGRRSLGMAVIHIWLIMLTLKLATYLPDSVLWGLALMAATAGALGLIAVGLDSISALWRQWQPTRPRFEYVAVPALIMVVVVTLGVANPSDPSQGATGNIAIAKQSGRDASVPIIQTSFVRPMVRSYSRPGVRNRTQRVSAPPAS